MATTLEILRNNREKAQEVVNATEMRKEFAKIASKFFAPYRKEQLAHIFTGATPEELTKEIDAFNKDTKNGTRLLVMLFDENKMKDNTITDKEGKVLFEDVTFFGKVNWKTDKEGNVVKVKSVYSVPFIPMSANDNDRVINYWYTYRENIEDSFAAIQEIKRTENANKIAALKEELQEAALSGDMVKVAEIVKKIKDLQK